MRPIKRRPKTLDRDSIIKRFVALADIRPGNVCWPWNGKRNKRGYGYFGVGGQGAGTKLAHRISWLLWRGRIPKGLWVLHRCDNPPCVNPNHLFLGTAKDNSDDCIAKGRNVPPPRKVKLNDDQVRSIRASDDSHKDAAARFNVSAEHIRRIRNGSTRSEVK